MSVNENANGAFVGELMTSDQDVGQTHIYKLLNSAGVKFMILNNKSHLRLIWVMKLKVSSRLGFSLKTMVGSLLVWQKIRDHYHRRQQSSSEHHSFACEQS